MDKYLPYLNGEFEKCDHLPLWIRKDDPDKKMCSLILLNTKTFDKGTDYANICSHESAHAAFHILDYCSIKLNDSTTEVFSFMTGWITECCVKTYKKKNG